jgi:hypothetical protein
MHALLVSVDINSDRADEAVNLLHEFTTGRRSDVGSPRRSTP